MLEQCDSIHSDCVYAFFKTLPIAIVTVMNTNALFSTSEASSWGPGQNERDAIQNTGDAFSSLEASPHCEDRSGH